MKVADAADGAGGDCDKLAAGLEALEPDVQALHSELAAAHAQIDDVVQDDHVLEARMLELRDPGVFDRCKKQSPRAKNAFDKTLDPILGGRELVAPRAGSGHAAGAATTGSAAAPP